jgi:hypothetical protein
MARQLAKMTLPLTALGGAALCAGGMTIVDGFATPGRQAVGSVTVSLQEPPQDWSETMQLRSICEDVPFRTFTVSPSAWRNIPGWETQIPVADGDCSTQVRLLPSKEDWIDAPIQNGACTLSVDPLVLNC